MARFNRMVLTLVAFITLNLGSFELHAADYWTADIPIMAGATNVVRSKDRERATIRASYDILLRDFREPLKFYGRFFESSGWKHHMAEVYEKFPQQFKRPPSQDWSSFAASSAGGSYRIIYGTLWQNKAESINASVKMTLSGITDDRVMAHIDIALGPQIDASPFLELVQRTKDDPKAALRLAEVAGGDPFDIDKVDLARIRSVKAPDELTLMYIKAVDSVLAQIRSFSTTHIPSD